MVSIIRRLAAWMIVLLLFSAEAPAEVRLVIGAGEWPPYTSEKDAHAGLLNRVVVESYYAVGIDVEIVFLPWARAIAMAERGEITATCCWFGNEDRRQRFLLTEPLYDVHYVFFHLKDYEFDWNDFDDLKGVSIGGIHEYYYGHEFTEYESAGRLHVERVPSDEINFRKLMAGRIDLYPVAGIESGYALLKEQFTEDERLKISYHPKNFMEDPRMYLLVSKHHPDAENLLSLFNQGLAMIKESGLYYEMVDEMRRKYSSLEE
jgi:polar amino acid transport system substrate-binding protein